MSAESPQSSLKNPVIVCMDSGVGGLSVLDRILAEFPSSPILFVGDTAWMPYGEKPLDEIGERVQAIYQYIVTHYQPAAFVLACNTATVAAYDQLLALNPAFPLLEPVETTANVVNREFPANLKIGILATPGTVKTKRYERFLDARFTVVPVACSGLASVIEAGHCDGPELDTILLPYLQILIEAKVDLVLLGCTHYSLIRNHIMAILNEALGDALHYVDSSDCLANEALPVIQELGLSTESAVQSIAVTGSNKAFEQAIAKLPLPNIHGRSVSLIATLSDSVVNTLATPIK